MRRALIAVLLLIATQPTQPVAWSQTPTPEQMEVFRNLPPAQQQQILDQIGESRGTSGKPAASPGQALPTTMPRADQTADKLIEPLEEEPRLRAGDSLLLNVNVKDAPDSKVAEQEGPSLTEYRKRLLDSNPYRLDRLGRLVLQGASPIVLAGLTAAEAVARLNADPELQDFTFGVKLLPVEPELRPFGYDLFSSVPTTFAPASDIPVPAEYVIGPGDTLQVQLIGERGGSYTLTVGRDGTIDFPQLGPIAVAGMKFPAVKDMLEQQVADQMIGMRASVSAGALRSIQVFVLGEAERPGSYTVSGLSTISNALFTSGGVKPIGSLRNIQLKRSGNVVQRLDLYDLLLNGDTSNDARLMPGDVIFIPPVGVTVAVTGEIQRPAIYEVKEGASVSDILFLAGGLTPEADPRTARLERIDGRRDRMVVDLDLTTERGRSTRLQTGDTLRIQAIRDSFEGAISLNGHVYHPGRVQYRKGMRLTDLIPSMDELKPLADAHYVLIRRETGPTREISVLSADLGVAIANPASESNVALQARDRVFVFDLAGSRDRVVEPIVADLARQSDLAQPLQVVNVGGQVKVPGQYPLEPDMSVSDVLRAGGGLSQAAYGGAAELTRYEVVNGERRQTQVIELDLPRLLAGDQGADIRLRPFDFVLIREVTDWRDREVVTIMGEVRFPGKYPARRGESLKSVISRAGGLTDLAFADGAVFTRKGLKETEQRQLNILAERLQRDLASLSLQQSQTADAAGTAQTISAGQGLLADLKSTQAVGRLVIDLNAVMVAEPGSPNDVLVKDGDQLVVPQQSQAVTIIGEVQSSTSHLFEPSLTRDDYIAMSGGTTERADKDRIYVVRANGSVMIRKGNRWFGQGASDIRPGDTIVVPYDAERMRPLPLWTAVTTIIFNLAIAVAAVGSL
jgi:protein involved in polysaccharide export with SLBB domain